MWPTPMHPYMDVDPDGCHGASFGYVSHLRLRSSDAGLMLVAGLTAVIQSVARCTAWRPRPRPVDSFGAETDSDGAAPGGSAVSGY
jgi:hypothetical protein